MSGKRPRNNNRYYLSNTENNNSNNNGNNKGNNVLNNKFYNNVNNTPQANNEATANNLRALQNNVGSLRISAAAPKTRNGRNKVWARNEWVHPNSEAARRIYLRTPYEYMPNNNNNSGSWNSYHSSNKNKNNKTKEKKNRRARKTRKSRKSRK
jgi:hypothetical protein